MPAINVAKTDTFESQRLKINQISNALFSVTSGGSDLSTGNLQLGDGLVGDPSLKFSSDTQLGIYKAGVKTIGFVNSGKKIADFKLSEVTTYQDINIQQRKLAQSLITLVSGGSGYDAGSYTSVPLIGGTGQNATVDLEVLAFDGSITNSGSGYVTGQYLSVPLEGGNGTGALVSFDITELEGAITNPGSAYFPSTFQNVPLTGGSGSGAEATIEISGTSTPVGSITDTGSGYTDGVYAQVQIFNEPVQTFVVTSVANPNAGGSGQPNFIYNIDGVDQPQLTLDVGNTYRFDLSDSSIQGENPGAAGSEHRMTFQLANGGSIDFLDQFEWFTAGVYGQAGCFTDVVIKPGATTGSNNIRYECSNHAGMGPAGGSITLQDTSTYTHYGWQGFFDVTISGGAVTDVQWTNTGVDYKTGDVVSIPTSLVGNTGSGFEYTISSITNTGIVDSVTITDSGTGYQNGDVLSVNDASVGSGGGSGFQWTVSAIPGDLTNFVLNERGSGYQIGDVLELPKQISNVSVYLPGESSPFTATLSTGSAQVVITDTSSLIVGLNVSGSAGDTGELAQGTTIASIDSATQITLSANPTVSGSANLIFSTTSANELTLTSTAGLSIGFKVEKVSGTGVLAADTTIANVDSATTVTLSDTPTTLGPAVVNFIPAFGDPADDFTYTIDTLGEVGSFTLVEVGNGYSPLDEFTVNSSDLTQPIVYPVTSKDVQKITLIQTVAGGTITTSDTLEELAGGITNISFTGGDIAQTTTGPLACNCVQGAFTATLADTTGISVGDAVTEDGSGNLAVNVTVASVDSATQVTLSAAFLQTASINLTFTSDESGTFSAVASTTAGNGSGATFDVERGQDGTISAVTINDGGIGYSDSDTLTIAGNLVGGATPANDITVTADTTATTTAVNVLNVNLDGSGNISTILLEVDQASAFTAGKQFIKTGVPGTQYTSDTAGNLEFRFLIDVGSGATLTPAWTIYVGNTYRFDTSDNSMSGHQFSLSKFRDGIYSPSLVENVSTTLNVASYQITVASTTGIQVGMLASKVSGDGLLASDTRVESIDSATQLTLTILPETGGATVVTFSGTEYTDGVERGVDYLDLTVTSATPNLYYYCASGAGHEDEGGEDNNEALITIDPNNPKTFGTGLLLRATDISSVNIVTMEVLTGEVTVSDIKASEGTIDILSAPDISSTTVAATTSVTTPLVTSGGSALTLSGSSVASTADFSVGGFSVTQSTSDVVTTGEIKTTDKLNVNDNIFIENNVISSDSGSDIVITAPTGKITKFTGFGSVNIPAGTTAQRPGVSGADNGSIRFNTDSNQYEGYSAATSSWSSLGGVRDLDGNTYITAELSIGSNDNTLWFYNDGANTVKFTPNELEFRTNKTIKSANTAAPAFTNWVENLPVLVGAYLKYKNNLYEVTVAGTTATSGNEPTHTSGAVPNGTATLSFWGLAVAPLTFVDVEEIRLDPLGSSPLVINGDLRLRDSIISTDISDLTFQPNAGKKIICSANTSIAIPSGTDSERGAVIQGGIRFNTTASQFEGYDGSNWGSLGGVKDVDQNTYIIPETSPGANENILYFYNDGTNTMRLTASALEFYSVDTIISSTSSEFEITASLMTFDNAETTLDNTLADRTFLHTSKQYFDLGLSGGLSVDPVLRLDNQGDVYFNTTFGTGNFTGVKVFDGDLKEFELADTKILTEKVTLTKGSANTGGSDIYNATAAVGAKTVVVAENLSNNDREFYEFGIIDNGTDIFHTEYGNVRTGQQLVVPTFERTAGNLARINFELGANLLTGHQIEITIVSTITKK
tara:strand:+ start:2882 stop:8272 length:5391 start_codon:yes stop_codon:yes gene_type:complete